MTEYFVFMYESALKPASLKLMGEYEADSQKKAIEKFKEDVSREELKEELDFEGAGHISTLSAVPVSYYGTFEINWRKDTVEKT